MRRIRRQQGGRLSQRLSQVHRRMDQAYQDKLAGKISEEFWMRKSGEWQNEENQPTYGKPFDLIFKKVKTVEWCARGDSNSRPSGS
jgi:hypothetical protein